MKAILKAMLSITKRDNIREGVTVDSLRTFPGSSYGTYRGARARMWRCPLSIAARLVGKGGHMIFRHSGSDQALPTSAQTVFRAREPYRDFDTRQKGLGVPASEGSYRGLRLFRRPSTDFPVE